MRVNSKAELIERLVPALPHDPEIAAWYLLGSGAQDRLRSESDVDLAVLPTQGMGVEQLALHQWAGDLALVLGREVDIGVLDNQNLVYAKEALLNGDLLWCRDARVLAVQTSDLLALYLTFQEDRKEVLDAYRR